MIPKRVRLAVIIAFLCHGLFILTAHYRLSYDAYTHMLFANHYAENWFSLWEPRWYTGFTVVSYPPLTHQLIGLFIPLLGFDAAFALILWTVATLYPLGVYSFSRIFTGKVAASYAALATAILLPIYVTAYVFGQLPFLTSTLPALFGAASLARYLRDGGLHDLALSVALAATTMAAHHATLIVQPFFMTAVIVSQINKENWRAIFFRLSTFSALAVVAGLCVIWPFWQWGTYQTMQTPIDHISRHDFISNPVAFAIFFLPLYGPLALLMPFMVRKWPFHFWGLLFSFVTLLLLGLGGTTPLPHLFFGENWAWLTYDRFAFWASLILTTFFGILFIQFRYGWKNRFTTQLSLVPRQRWDISTVTFSLFAVIALGAWLQPFLFPTQPQPINMRPIVSFLNQGDNSDWRYLTLGFGNQFAYLNLLTRATTIDGSYHTVRTLPELRESGIAEIDTSYWMPKGVAAIGPILQKSGAHGVRWGFVNRKEFIPELKKDGWQYFKTLSNGIQVWENPRATIPETTQPLKVNPFTAFSWGVFPILSLITTLSLGALRVYPVAAERVIRTIYSFLITLLPVSLCLWYYRPIFEFPHYRVYFTYTDALFFLSDGLVWLAVILWLAVRVAQSSVINRQVILRPSSFILALFLLFLLFSVSVFWSSDWRVSLYISLHFWLIFLLVLSLRDWSHSWNSLMLGLCIALSIQLIMGFVGFALQSTAFLKPLGLEWPGPLNPFTRGAVIVNASNELRVLRAYGTFPHPNILGGFTVVALLGPISLFFKGEKLYHPVLILYALGVSLLALTFSRSAWFSITIFLLILILKSKYLNRQKLILLLSITLLSCMITLLPRLQLVLARSVNITTDSEKFSFVGRAWLNQEAIQIFREHPLIGTGIGSFIIELSQRAGYGYIIEPVHNIFLSTGAELGLVGLALITVLFISIVLKSIKAQTPKAILGSATLAGLGVISLFDHYLWTLSPGRLMLGLILGLWFGQVLNNKYEN